MTRLLSALLLLLFSAAQAWGATYYVDPANGADSNAGTASGTAWQSLEYADEMIGAGDTLVVLSTATGPARHGFTTAAATTTIRGTSSTVRGYIAGSEDVSHGATIPDRLRNGSAEAWLTTNSLWGWTFSTGGTSTIARSATAYAGVYSIEMVRGDTSNYIRQDSITLPASTAMTLSWRMQGTATKQIFYEWKNTTNNTVLQDDLTTWNSTANTILCTALTGPGTWNTHTLSFTSGAAGAYRLTVYAPTASTVYLDNLSLTYDTGTWSWSLVPDHNYYVLSPIYPYPLTLPNADPSTVAHSGTVATSTAAAWTTSGLTALSPRAVQITLEACDATEGSYWYDTTNKLLYYRPATGESMATLHVEASANRHDATVSTWSPANITHATTTLQNLSIWMAGLVGVRISGAADSTTLTDVDVHLSAHSGVVSLAGATTATRVSSDWTGFDDGFYADGTTSLICARCESRRAAQDDFQCLTGANLTLRYSLALGGREGTKGGGHGVSCEAGGVLIAQNNTILDSIGNGIVIDGCTSNGHVIQNNLVWGQGYTDGIYKSPDSGTWTESYNLYTGTDLSGTGDLFGVDPLLRNEYRLSPGSPAINAGTDLCATLTDATDYAGTSVCAGGVFSGRGSAPDIGAYESIPYPQIHYYGH